MTSERNFLWSLTAAAFAAAVVAADLGHVELGALSLQSAGIAIVAIRPPTRGSLVRRAAAATLGVQLGVVALLVAAASVAAWLN